jgi:hypothetical protein
MGVETTTNIILGSLRYASSPNVNDEIDISLTQNTKELVDFDRVVDLSLETVYDDERQSSTIFRHDIIKHYDKYNYTSSWQG